MAKNKTIKTDHSVFDFVALVDNEQQRIDSLELIKLLQEISGTEPRLWGTNIIGLGNYHYKYASGHEGDAALVGFSPRKNAISLYMCANPEGSKQLLQSLGKYRMGKSCIYIKKLADIDTEILKQLVQKNIEFLMDTYSAYN